MNQPYRTVTLILIVVLAAALCVSWWSEAGQAATPRAADDAPASRTIMVSGTSEVRVVPDEVILTVGVESVHVDMETAKAENDAIVERALGLLDAFGVESRHAQTDFINIEPRYDTYYDRKTFIGYFVRRNIAITLRDLTQFEGLLSALLDAGVTHVHGIDFRTTELRQHKDQARALAIQAAEEKAAAMAAELGQSLGRPILVREEHSGWASWYSSWWGSYWGGSMAQNVVQNMGDGEWSTDGALALGQIAINAQVSVTFELLGN
jgi:uncharacterized protein YggE